MDKNIINSLSDSLSTDKVTRENGETGLRKLVSQDYGNFMKSLSEVMVSTNDIAVRQLAGIVLKNNISERWFSIDNRIIKDNLISVMVSDCNDTASKSAASALATICKFEKNQSTEFVEILVSQFNDNNIVKVSECLSFICEELYGVGYSNDILTDKLMKFIFTNLTTVSNLSLLKLLYNLLPLAEGIFNKDNERKYILNTLFGGDINHIDDNTLEWLLKCGIQISLFYYKHLHDCMNLLAGFTLSIIKQRSDKLILLAIEVWCTLGDKELSNSSVFESNQSFRYFERYADNIIEFCLSNIHRVSDDDSWSISKACSYVLAILVQLTDSKYLEKLLLYVETNFKGDYKHNALLVLTCCLETVHKDTMTHVLKFNFDSFFGSVYDTGVQQTASWLFCKITELYCHVFDKPLHGTYIPKILDLIVATGGSTRINLCKSLCNIIIHFGDKKTKRNNNPMSGYYSSIIETLTKLAITDPSGTTYPLFQVITTIVEYSSDDFQEFIEDLLGQYIDIYVDINRQLSGGMSNSKLLDIQENICIVFQEIFNKIIRQVREDLCMRLFNAVIESFKIRKSIIELGLYSLSYVALSKYNNLKIDLKKKFVTYTPIYMEYIIYGLKQYTDDYLLKTSVMSVCNLVNAIESNFNPYVDYVIPLLIDSLASGVVQQSTKLNCITCLSDISMFCPGIFTHLDSIMEIILSACSLASERTDDPDIREYLISLRDALLQTISAIVIATGENGRHKEFSIYVTQIIGFIKQMNSDDGAGNGLKHTSLALLGDMICLYHSELRPLLRDGFLTELIQTLRLTYIKKYEKTIEWVENLYKSI
jgi:hypothetical protein